jgi:hypothetical protein
MKTQLFIISLFFLLNARASELDLAIEASDFKKVQLLISNQPLKEKEIVKYLDYADKMIVLRRELMVCAQMGRLGYCPQLVRAQIIAEGFASLAGVLGFFAPITFFSEKKGKEVGPILAGLSLITAIPAVYFYKRAKRLLEEKIESFSQNHSNALKIKEILFDIA